MSGNEWIYDWNRASAPLIPPGARILLNDETLRDGLQNPSVHDPSIGEKIKILHLMEALGLDSVNIGLPGAGPRAVEHAEALAREIASNRMKIRPNCAARTHENDIRPIAEISQKVGIAIEAATFLGTSPIRRLVEDWTVDHLERTTEAAVKFAVSHNLPSMYVTEDTIRTDPETVKRLYSTAIRSGARAIVLCDTVGHATPQGAYNLVKFAFDEIVIPCGEKIRVDWHGHNDRGLAIANSLWAIAAGAHQIHGAANSLGERVGNTADGTNARESASDGPDRPRPLSAQGILRNRRRSNPHDHSRQLSGLRQGCISHRDRRTRRRDRQSISQRRRRPGQRRLQRRARAIFWTRANHRNRPDERKIQRPFLARAPQNSCGRRTRIAPARRRQTIRACPHR